MDIYTQVPDKTTREALRRLSDLFDIDQADEPGSDDEHGEDRDKPR
jgi:hypothetical protein